jgi:hypothetical protein
MSIIIEKPIDWQMYKSNNRKGYAKNKRGK